MIISRPRRRGNETGERNFKKTLPLAAYENKSRLSDDTSAGKRHYLSSLNALGKDNILLEDKAWKSMKTLFIQNTVIAIMLCATTNHLCHVLESRSHRINMTEV